MPTAAEVRFLRRFLDDLHDLGVIRQGLDKGIARKRPETPGEGGQAVGIEPLAAKEDHQVFEKRAMDFRELGRGEIRREIDPVDLGPQGAGDRAHVYRPIGHFQFATIQPHLLPISRSNDRARRAPNSTA